LFLETEQRVATAEEYSVLSLLLPWLFGKKEQSLCLSPETYKLGHSWDVQPTIHRNPEPYQEPPPLRERFPPHQTLLMDAPAHNYLNLGVYFVTIFWITLALTLLYYKHLCNHASQLI
jgi:hypothetical protein